MGRYAIGVDYGSLSGRAVLVNLETGREAASAVYEYPHGVMDEALEQQVGMIDPRRSVLDMAMDNEIVALHERIRELQQENQRLRAENEKMQKALSRRNDKLLRNL